MANELNTCGTIAPSHSMLLACIRPAGHKGKHSWKEFDLYPVLNTPVKEGWTLEMMREALERAWNDHRIWKDK